MSYLLALQRLPTLTLATTEPVLPPQDLQRLPDALALCERLNALLRTEGERIALAVSAARARGLAEGRAQGEANARAEAAQQVQATLQAMVDQQRHTQAELRQAVVTLALLVLRRMAADLGPHAMVAALLQRAFEQVGGDERCSVRVHPSLLPAVRERLPGAPVHEWIADDTLQPFDCVLESPHGRLLAGLDAQLQQVQQALQAAEAQPHGEAAWTA